MLTAAPPDAPARPASSGRAASAPATAFRVMLLVLCSTLSVFAGERTYVALPIALLAALAYAMERVPYLRAHPLQATLLEAVLVGVAVSLTGGAFSPLLPYLLAPGLALGLAGTWRDVTKASVGVTVGLVTGRVVYELGAGLVPDSTLGTFVREVGLWVLLGQGIGLIAGWAQRLSPPASVPTADRYVEARELLEQLRRVTRRLPGGLDAATAAEALLDRLADVVTVQRSAVLVQTGAGSLVPAAVRGTTRVPWRAPLTAPGPLQQAWQTGLPVVDTRKGDVHGRRRGSCMCVVPLSSGNGPMGLLILENYEDGCFPQPVVDEIAAAAAQASLRLQTALLFEEVRSTVVVEERDRLAREMHDGVAQEIAFVGYQLDDLRIQAAKVDAPLAGRISDVRKDLTRLISDIRLSITDLKTSVNSDFGLGSAITGYVRAIGSGSKVTVHVSLQESTFRLPGDTEVVLFQITQAVAQDVRRTGHASNLWVTLVVDPPSARLQVEHDGDDDDLEGLDLSPYAEHLSRLGGTLQTGPRRNGGVRVEVVLEGGQQ